MISWTMIACLKLASLGLTFQCADAGAGKYDNTEFFTEHAPTGSGLVKCLDTSCLKAVRAKGEEEGYTVVFLPRHKVFAWISPAEPQNVTGAIIAVLQHLDAVR